MQLERERSENSEASEERWVLNGLGSEFTAEAVAAIKPDGSAVTGQWRRGDKYFTLVIVRRDDDLKGFFLGRNAEECNIPRMPSTLKDDEVSMDRSWATYIQYQDVPGSFQFGRTFFVTYFDRRFKPVESVQIGDWSPCVPHGKMHND